MVLNPGDAKEPPKIPMLYTPLPRTFIVKFGGWGPGKKTMPLSALYSSGLQQRVIYFAPLQDMVLSGNMLAVTTQG